MASWLLGLPFPDFPRFDDVSSFEAYRLGVLQNAPRSGFIWGFPLGSGCWEEEPHHQMWVLRG